MIFYPRLLLRGQFEIVEVGDDVTAIGVGDGADAYKGVIELKNDSARFMFKKLREGITLPELIKACMDEYTDSTVEEVGPKVLSFLDQLKEKGLIAVDKEHGMRVEN